MALTAGETISDNLSQFVSFFTVTQDLKDSAKDMGKSVELLRAILRQERVLTESNIPLIYSVLRKAVAKRQLLMPLLNSSYREAKKIIEQNSIPTT